MQGARGRMVCGTIGCRSYRRYAWMSPRIASRTGSLGGRICEPRVDVEMKSRLRVAFAAILIWVLVRTDLYPLDMTEGCMVYLYQRSAYYSLQHYAFVEKCHLSLCYR